MKKLLNDYNLLDVKCKYDLGGNRNIYIYIYMDRSNLSKCRNTNRRKTNRRKNKLKTLKYK
jgi:hypothetical protein